MKFDQLVQYKALDRIHTMSGSDLVDRVSVPDSQKAQMKNVCALISVALFDELEEMCCLLGLSKRQFIEASVIEGLAKANKIIEEVGLHEAFDEHKPHPRTFGLPSTLLENLQAEKDAK